MTKTEPQPTDVKRTDDGAAAAKDAPITVPAGEGMSLTTAVFGLCKSAIGAGALGLPRKLLVCGTLGGSALLIFSSFVCTLSLHFLARISAHTNLSSYFAIGRMAYGRKGEIAVMIALVIFLFGGLIMYAKLAGDNFIQAYSLFKTESSAAILANVIEEHNKKYVTLVMGVVLFFVALLRDMRLLGKTSIVGMLCMIYLFAILIVDVFASPNKVNWNFLPEKTPDFKTFMLQFGGIIFAFSNHFTMVSTVPAMEAPTSKRRFLLTAFSGAGVLAYYMIFAFAGLLPNVEELTKKTSFNPMDILRKNAMKIPFMIGNAAFAIMLLLSFPLLCDPLRACLENIIFPKVKPETIKMFSSTNILLTFVAVSIPTLIAMFFAELADSALSIFSTIAGSLLLFIFPAGFLLRLAGPAKYRVSQTERILAYFCLAFGFFVLLVGGPIGAHSAYGELKEIISKMMTK